jgi:23S rRNA pseudouridine1911/1915/1917 synthase
MVGFRIGSGFRVGSDGSIVMSCKAMSPPEHPHQSRGEFDGAAGLTLAAALRQHLPERSWRQVREMCASGKVTVDGEKVVLPAHRLVGGEKVAWHMGKPDPRRHASPAGFRIVYEDGHLVVIEKPEGVSTVPYERKETGTALDLIRDAWRGQGKRATVTPLYTVHRIDKDTSGLVCFAKTKLAERGLHRIFKEHLADREYIAVAHGRVSPGRIESHLIQNRGDGLRGSARRFGGGQHAITDVEVVEQLGAATVCRVRLRTGRTHQIRIHLAEQGHPLVGETVYIRDLLRGGGKPIPCSRLLLHAATLGFDHPVTGKHLHFAADLPPEFMAEVTRLRG